MSFLVSPPLSVLFTDAGLNPFFPEVLNPPFIFVIYYIQLASTRQTRDITIFENGIPRWKGAVKNNETINLDFGPNGWRIDPEGTVEIELSGNMDLHVNILQWGTLPIAAQS